MGDVDEHLEPDAESILIENFHKTFQPLIRATSDASVDQAIKLVRMAVARLLTEPIPAQKLIEWSTKLKDLILTDKGPKSHLKVKVEIIYGLRSLMLKNLNFPDILRPIENALEELFGHLKKGGQDIPIAEWEWGQELLNPTKGFSESLIYPGQLSKLTSKSDFFQKVIKLAFGSSKNMAKAVQMLNQVFEHPNAFTSQARITSIALMNHVMATEEFREYIPIFHNPEFRKREGLLFENEQIIIESLLKAPRKTAI